MLVHLVDLLFEIEARRIAHDDFLHVRRERVQVTLEIGCDIFGIVQKFGERVLARVVELEFRNLAHRLVGVVRIFLELRHNLRLGLCKRTFKPADNHHRDNNILVLVALVGAAERVRDGPNKVDFSRNIYRGIVKNDVDDLVLGHEKSFAVSRVKVNKNETILRERA